MKRKDQRVYKMICDYARIKGQIHVPKFNREALLFLVEIALKHEEITMSRAAEIMGVPLWKFREQARSAALAGKGKGHG